MKNITQYHDILAFMVKAIHMAGKIIEDDFCQTDRFNVHLKNKSEGSFPDYVTSTDIKAEEVIKKILYEAFPDIPFVGEETGGDDRSERYFICDPLDGTSNFLAGRDYFATALAYVEEKKVKIATIMDPIKKDIVTAIEGQGAFLNSAPVLLEKLTNASPVAIQLECEIPVLDFEEYPFLKPLLQRTSGLRKSGSTLLDIVNILKGRHIICVTSALERHDIAPCILIMEEAEGIIRSLQNKKITLEDNAFFAMAPSFFDDNISKLF